MGTHTLGMWSGNEILALKKNLSEETKLKEVTGSLFIDHALTKHKLTKNFNTVKKELREIQRCTGCSREGIRPRSFSSSSFSSMTSTTGTYDVPEGLINRSARTYGMMRPRKSIIAEIDSAVMKEGSSDAFNYIQYTNALGTKQNTEGCLHIERTRTMPERTGMVKSKEVSFIETKDVSFIETGKPFLRTRNQEEENEESTKSKTSEDIENELEKKIAYLNMKYNPWNIRHRNGVSFNSLELPKIKDCHRPVCRPSCVTCKSRKAKAPCFIIPGLITTEHPASKYDIKAKRTSARAKKQRKCVEALSVDPVVENEKEDAVRNCVFSKPSTKSEPSTIDLQIQKSVKFVVKTETAKLSKQRLEELSAPKDGFNAFVRITRASIRRESDRLKKKDHRQILTAHEQERRRNIDSRIGMFLALENLQSQPSVPTRMVDIPIRDDVMKVDISHIAPNVDIGAHVKIQKMYNEKKRKSLHVEFL